LSGVNTETAAQNAIHGNCADLLSNDYNRAGVFDCYSSNSILIVI